ncbi:MAG: VanZ family protein [Gemmatimonadetes bacterium]|nr:VanZ family protein [Gemmatimonadota bacterium]
MGPLNGRGALPATPLTRRWVAPAAWTAVVLAVTLTPLEAPARGVPGLDLLVHATLFGVLAALVLWAHPGPGRAGLAVILAVLLAFAALDELAQSFVPGRTSSWRDVAADASGILLGLLYRAGMRSRHGSRRFDFRPPAP